MKNILAEAILPAISEYKIGAIFIWIVTQFELCMGLLKIWWPSEDWHYSVCFNFPSARLTEVKGVTEKAELE